MTRAVGVRITSSQLFYADIVIVVGVQVSVMMKKTIL